MVGTGTGPEDRTGRGRAGEALAASALEADGWRMLDRNFRDGPREVDLVMTRGDVLAFVEVRTRASTRWGDPLETLSGRKRREVERAARAWLRRHSGPWRSVRFDAVAILWLPGGIPELRHIPDAWRPASFG